jgi:hypothetical protein
MASSLRVDRAVLHSRTTSRAAAPGPDAVAGRLVDALRGIAPVDRGGIWLIRSLDVHATVAGGNTARATASSLAAAVVRQLDRTLEAGPDAADVRWYPDRAAFLEQWLVDVCSGAAASSWEYRRFAADSAAAAIRRRAAAEPANVWEALRRLPVADLDAVLNLLAAADVSAVVHAVATGHDTKAVPELVGSARRLTTSGRLPQSPQHATLLLLLSDDARRGPPGPDDASRASEVARVVFAVRSCSRHDRGSLLRALRDADWGTATRLGGTGAVEALAGWPKQVRIRAMAELLQATEPATEATPEGYTALGGQFLLLPLLAELPLAAATAQWPALEGTTAPHVLLGALATAGVLGSPLVLTDPYFRLGTGLPQYRFEELVRWIEGVDAARLTAMSDALIELMRKRGHEVPPDRSDSKLLVAGLPRAPADAVRVASIALLRELSYRLPGMARASVAHLRRNLLTLDAHVTVDDERVLVQLGSPPLQLLLSLTGMNRRSYTLPATGSRPWLITTRR